MAGYTQKTLMQNERILYSAEEHIFNYFPSIAIIIIGLIMSGILEPRVPQELRKYEVINEISQDIDSRVAEVTKSVDEVNQKVKQAARKAPREVKHAVSYVSKARFDYFGFMFLFVGFINLLRQYIADHTTEYSVTSKRVIHKFGFITTDTNEINLDRVEGIKVKQSISDKLVGRGDVIINGIGMEQIMMERVSKPEKLRIAILEAVSRYTQKH